MVVICPRCEKEITTVRKIEWMWFAPCLLLGAILIVSLGLSLTSVLIGVIPALIYVFYHFTKAPRTCPICGYGNIYDKGRELDKDKIKQLKKRLMDLDYELEHYILTKTEKEKFIREIHEVAEELRKYGFKGTVKGRNLFSKERKY